MFLARFYDERKEYYEDCYYRWRHYWYVFWHIDLSRYDVDITLIERESDVCDEVSSANSAIIHAGYDPEEHTLKALIE